MVMPGMIWSATIAKEQSSTSSRRVRVKSLHVWHTFESPLILRENVLVSEGASLGHNI